VVVVLRQKDNHSISLVDPIEDEPQPRQRRAQPEPADQQPIPFQAAQFAEWRRRRQEED
jgi:hypothetical protein